ncbi:twin-arginine translocation signal domain-containing protein [Chloroflexi bacterium CFX2]|nr:twin-arginine translocation signal domain-containing protein [Chloroflexi bacterium CFX2]
MPTKKRTNKSLSRREFLKFGAVAGGSAVLAACAPGGGGRIAARLGKLRRNHLDLQSQVRADHQ